jgi:hypothetical protein
VIILKLAFGIVLYLKNISNTLEYDVVRLQVVLVTSILSALIFCLRFLVVFLNQIPGWYFKLGHG